MREEKGQKKSQASIIVQPPNIDHPWLHASSELRVQFVQMLLGHRHFSKKGVDEGLDRQRAYCQTWQPVHPVFPCCYSSDFGS